MADIDWTNFPQNLGIFAASLLTALGVNFGVNKMKRGEIPPEPALETTPNVSEFQALRALAAAIDMQTIAMSRQTVALDAQTKAVEHHTIVLQRSIEITERVMESAGELRGEMNGLKTELIRGTGQRGR